MIRKDILLIAPDYYGFDEVIYKGLENFAGANVFKATSAFTESYKYKNFLEKFQNFFMKVFFKKNLKILKRERIFLNLINCKDKYDLIIINRPDILRKETLLQLKNKTEKMVAVYWDSMDKINGQKETIPYFDICYSFDEEDCKKYSLVKNNNFYIEKSLENYSVDKDVLFYGTEDKRIYDLNKILEYLNHQNLIAKGILYNHKSEDLVPHPNFCNIVITNKLVKFKDSYKVNLSTKIILDLSHNNQSGLSFRPFEAIALKKKLITTNKNIKTYDFYNPNNIFIIEDVDNINIPQSFFDYPYNDIPKELLDKYSLENWIKNICK
jgi:hypothetical protein